MTINWERVFDLRCKAKRGGLLTDEEQAEVQKAYHADPVRYVGLTPRVHEATHPAGPKEVR